MAGPKKNPRKSTGCNNAKQLTTKQQVKKNIPQKSPVLKPYRYRPSALARREIRRYPKPTKLPSQCVVKRTPNCFKKGMLFKRTVMDCLQETSETYLRSLYENEDFRTIHAKRLIIRLKDIWLARRIRGERS